MRPVPDAPLRPERSTAPTALGAKWSVVRLPRYLLCPGGHLQEVTFNV